MVGKVQKLTQHERSQLLDALRNVEFMRDGDDRQLLRNELVYELGNDFNPPHGASANSDIIAILQACINLGALPVLAGALYAVAGSGRAVMQFAELVEQLMSERAVSDSIAGTDTDVENLRVQISSLEEEVTMLRRRLLANGPQSAEVLEKRLRQTESSLVTVTDENGRLVRSLREARDQLKNELDSRNRISARTGIFVVHGHDERLKLEVARLLEGVTNEEITILAERPNRGRTIIEKLEQYCQVGFAIVLLTPDDRAVSSTTTKARGRARQNVIFELGLFIGLLGRDRVCALYKSDLELPSDYAGVLFIEADDRGAWKLELLRELQAVGIQVDWQRIK